MVGRERTSITGLFAEEADVSRVAARLHCSPSANHLLLKYNFDRSAETALLRSHRF